MNRYTITLIAAFILSVTNSRVAISLSGPEKCMQDYGIEDARYDIINYLTENSGEMTHMYKLHDVEEQVGDITIEERRMKERKEWHIEFTFDNGCGTSEEHFWIKIQCEPRMAVPGTFAGCK